MSEEELEKDIDHDFFEDENFDKSETISYRNDVSKQNSNVLSDKENEDSDYSFAYEKSSESSNEVSLKKSEKDEEKKSVSSNSSSSSTHSEIVVASSIDNSKAKSNRESETFKSRSSYSNMTSSKDSVTTVSDMDSESESILDYKSKSRLYKKPPNVNISSVDKDLISPQVILAAMLRIRKVQSKIKPPWINPNTKDYSTSGIAEKLNLTPQYLVSVKARHPNGPGRNGRNNNLRVNPFHVRNNEFERLKMYHTAINRTKELDRIERENELIKSRLQKIQPSPGISRNELLNDYTQHSRFQSGRNSRCNSRTRQVYSTASSNRATTPTSTFSNVTLNSNKEFMSNRSNRSQQHQQYNDNNRRRNPSVASTIISSNKSKMSRPLSRDATSIKRRS